MNEFHSAWEMHLNEEEKNSARRQLRRLRIALIAWIVIFLLAVLWFYVAG